MRPQRVWTDDGGSAALEFIFAGVVLLVPIVYLIIAMGQIQSHALGVETGARQLARAIATAENLDDADGRASLVTEAIAREYGIDPETVSVSISCDPVGDTCPQAGVTVRVVVSASAKLPLVPPVFGMDEAARFVVESTSIQKVSRSWDG